MTSGGEVSIERLDPETTSEQLWDQFFRCNDELIREVSPTTALPPREHLRAVIENPDPRHVKMRWLIFPKESPNVGRRESVIGWGSVHFGARNSPSYEDNAHIIYGKVAILPSYRQHGIGTQLLRKIIAKAQELGKTTLFLDAQLEVGHRFCRNLGGQSVSERSEIRMDLTALDWDMVRRWQADGRRRSPGTKIEIYSTVPSSDIDEFVELLNQLGNQQPSGGHEARFKESPQARRAIEARLQAGGIEITTMISRESDGAISGMTDRYYDPTAANTISIGMTGVRDKYRGRGLGKWLKAEMLLHIQTTYPTVQIEQTSMEVSNSPMRSINERLGYKYRPPKISYRFDVAELAEAMAKRERR